MPKIGRTTARTKRARQSRVKIPADHSHSSEKEDNEIAAEESQDEDIIEVPLEMDDWLLNQIDDDVNDQRKRNIKKYSGLDVCIIGLERIIAIAESEHFYDLPLATLDSQLQLVLMYQQKFYEQCINSAAKNVTAVEMQQKQACMKKVDRMVNWLQQSIMRRKKQIMVDESLARIQTEAAAHNSTGINTTQSSHIAQDVRVKKVEIPKFSGVLRQWPAFKKSFEDCFHKNPIMLNTTKFYHLMSHLEEGSEAYNTIDGMDRTDEGYEAAWKLLCDVYDNDRAIVEDVIKHFLDMPSITTPSRTAFVNVINATNVLLSMLPQYKIEVRFWDPILVSLIIRKLDGASRREWVVKRHQRAVPKLKPLLDFLRQRADAIDDESIGAFGGNSIQSYAYQQNGSNQSYQYQQNASYQSKPVSSNGNFRGANGGQYLNVSSSSRPNENLQRFQPNANPKIVRCHHCNGLHRLFDCKEFIGMNQELKRGRLESIGVCVKCLRKGHAYNQCRKSKNCECGEPHNPLICPKSKPSAAVLSIVQS